MIINVRNQPFAFSFAGDGAGLTGVGQQQQQAGTAPPAGEGAGEEAPAGGMNFLVIGIWVAMFAAIYFLMLRPRSKQQKAARAMQANLKVGENVVTTSGFYGKIVGVGADAFLIEFGENRGLRVWVNKGDIAAIKSPATTPPRNAEEIKDRGEKDKEKDKKD